MQSQTLFSVVSNTPSATTRVMKAFGQLPQPKPGKGVCSAVLLLSVGRMPSSGVVSALPMSGVEVVST